MTKEDLLENLCGHSSDISKMHFLNLLETVVKLLLRLLFLSGILVECLFGKSHDDFVNKLVHGF